MSELIQESTVAGTTAKATAAVRNVVEALPSSVSLKPEQASLLGEFLSASSAAKYAPQSWTVQGILKDMYDTFAKDLEASYSDEASANRNYEDFMHTKAEELTFLQSEKAVREEEKAEKEEELADAQEAYDKTEAQMKADIVFFDETKKACEEKHSEWEVRSGLREEELAGIVKALSFLTSDENRELFASAIKEGKETWA